MSTSHVSAAQNIIPQSGDLKRLEDELELPLDLGKVPAIIIPRSSEDDLPPDAEQVTFVFDQLHIVGAEKLQHSELRARWPHEAGETISVADVFSFASVVTQAYLEEGYVLSFGLIPEQTISDGVVTVQVVEGFIEDVAVEGIDPGSVRSTIERLAYDIVDGEIARTVELERFLLLVNDLPGVSARSVLSPGTQTGGAVLTVFSSHDALTGGAGLSDFLPASYGRRAASVFLRVSGYLTGADALSFSLRNSVQGGAYRSIGVSGSSLVGASGLSVSANVSYVETDPNTPVLNALEFVGASFSAAIGAAYPVVLSRDEDLEVGAKLRLSNSSSRILGVGFQDDRLREFILFSEYGFLDSGLSRTVLSASVTQGLEGLGARGNGRANAALDFTKVNLGVTRRQPMGSLAEGTLSVLTVFDGQWTVGSRGLFGGAECSYGGREFGRGFESSAVTGDHCLKGLVSLNWLRGAQLPEADDLSLFDFYLFADGGVAWENGPLTVGARRRAAAASSGVGVNFRLAPQVSGLIEVNRQLALSEGAIDRSPRVTGRLVFTF